MTFWDLYSKWKVPRTCRQSNTFSDVTCYNICICRWGHVVSTWRPPVQVQKQTQYWIWPETPADKHLTIQHRTLFNTTDTTTHSYWL